jgi:DNA polymerase V
VGIPVSIGIGPTKTLAKVATHIAKKNARVDVYDLRLPVVRDIILRNFLVADVWGIGRKTAEKLSFLKIHTVSQLFDQPAQYLRKKFGVMMTRVVSELQGTSCVSLEETHSKKNIMCSRSFGRPVTALSDLLEAISSYAARACEKARAQQSKAQAVVVYARTSLYHPTRPYYSASEQQTLLLPSNDTVLITRVANVLIEKIYKPNFHYQKAGVILLNLISDNIQQTDLFESDSTQDNKVVMSLVDDINARWGSHTLFLAAEGIAPCWSVKSVKRSYRYTTSWSELLTVKT